jgi:O-antigen/teichoic acid export membrane protein
MSFTHYFKTIKELAARKKSKQVAALYSAMVIGIVVSIAVSAINTRALAADGFGDYKFLQNLSMFVVSCGTAGLFVSSGRLIALPENATRTSSLAGGALVYCALLYCFFAIIFWLFSYVQPDYFDRDLGILIRMSLPLAVGYLLKVLLENLLKGANHIYSLSLMRFSPNLLYLCYAFVLFRQDELDVAKAYMGFLVCSLAVFVLLLATLRPSFKDIGKQLVSIKNETRRYGFNVYIGSLASVASAQLGGVLVAYLIDTRSGGFFLLARTITLPLVQLSTVVGTTFFKSFAIQDKIDNKLMLLNVSSVSILLLIFLLVIEPVVTWLYPPEFFVIIGLCYIMAIGSTLQGIGGLLNNFLCAKGYGKYSRNASLLRGLVNIIGYTLGVAQFGLYGAAWTVLFAGAVFTAAQYAYYQHAIKQTKLN